MRNQCRDQVSVPLRARSDNCAHCQTAAAVWVSVCVSVYALVRVFFFGVCAWGDRVKPRGQEAHCHLRSCLCVSWRWTLTARFSSLSSLTLCGPDWCCRSCLKGPPSAGTAVQVYRHRVLWPDQGGVPVPASPVSQVTGTAGIVLLYSLHTSILCITEIACFALSCTIWGNEWCEKYRDAVHIVWCELS